MAMDDIFFPAPHAGLLEKVFLNPSSQNSTALGTQKYQMF